MKYIFYISFILSLVSYGQQSWQAVPNVNSNTGNQRFDDVFFLNDNLGWAANGFYAAVFKTEDGGLTWSEQLSESSLGSSHYFRNIEFLNENIGFLGTLNGKFYKTIDGGTNWTLENSISPNPTAICGINTVGSNTVYGCGAYFTPAHIIKSTDSGNTWTYIDMSAYADALVEIKFLTETHGYAAGKNAIGGLILETLDGGSTWTEIYNSNIAGDYVWKLQILHSNQSVIFGAVTSVSPHPGKLIKSNDSGTTWNSFDAPETDIQAVGFINESQGWMGGHNTGFYETLDGGQSWNNLNVGSNLNRIFVLNETLAYASGTTVYKYTDQNLNTDDYEESSRIPLNVSINKNPVSNTLELSIGFESDDNLLIEIYNINGQFIKRLSREIITQPITKDYSFNVSDFSTGIYILNFHSNTGRSSLKFTKL